MSDRLRAPLAAAAALLIGGDLAVQGPGALFDVWRFLFPYLWLFLALEFVRRRRGRLLDEEAFLLGAAAGLLHDGAYAKVLQDGIFFLGINSLSALTACFDWGLVTVVALHVARALRPRPAEESSSLGTPEILAFWILPALAFVFYLYDAWVGATRFQRMLGPAWLLADILFAAAAAALVRRALGRPAADERLPGLWALAAFCGWLPGAQLAVRAGGQSSVMVFVLVSLWTAGVGVWIYRLWLARGGVDPEPRRAVRAVLALAAWRLAGAVLIWLILGPADGDERVPAAFAFFVDLPTRLIFLSVFFSERLEV